MDMTLVRELFTFYSNMPAEEHENIIIPSVMQVEMMLIPDVLPDDKRPCFLAAAIATHLYLELAFSRGSTVISPLGGVSTREQNSKHIEIAEQITNQLKWICRDILIDHDFIFESIRG